MLYNEIVEHEILKPMFIALNFLFCGRIEDMIPIAPVTIIHIPKDTKQIKLIISFDEILLLKLLIILINHPSTKVARPRKRVYTVV